METMVAYGNGTTIITMVLLLYYGTRRYNGGAVRTVGESIQTGVTVGPIGADHEPHRAAAVAN